jgi:pimeloyl-ACP methyl ester carboxylesterase
MSVRGLGGTALATALLSGVLGVCAASYAETPWRAPAAGMLAAHAARVHDGSPATLRLGSQRLTRCGLAPLAYCGTLAVALDHTVANSPTIAIAYHWYPASAPHQGGAAGTVVPVEGGPGYPSSGSVKGGYSVMYGPLLERWNMLAVDNRGTGRSSPLRCPALQDFSGPTASAPFQQAAAGCAAALNHRWRYPDGSWVHGSDMFTSTPAAEDLAAVIGALGLGKVDLYGDSYGSFFAQVFAAHFPRLVRSVVLDSTYQTQGLDPWYRSAVSTMPAAFDSACARAPACAAAAPGSAWTRIGALAARLRAEPVSGVVPGPSGSRKRVEIGVVGLVDLINDAAGDPQIYRGLDAAARALLGAGDAAPLLRLYAQRLAEDESYFGAPLSEYSAELYLAVSCLDYQQLFDMHASPALRSDQLAAGQSALAADTFSPFSIIEWLAQDQNTEAYSACLQWPSPTSAQPPTSGVTPLFASGLPVLVLGGELDSWTPPVDVPKVLAEIGGHSRFIELANATHVVGEGDTLCGSSLIQRFVADPSALDSLDASCAPAVPPIHSVGVYPAQLAEQPPLVPLPGSSATPANLQLVAAGVATAGDAVARYMAIEAALDHGLMGGTVTASHGGSLLTLAGDRLIAGVPVSGTVELAPSPIPLDGFAVTARLSLKASGMASVSLTATWTTAGAGAQARVLAELGGQSLSGTMPAP